MTIFFNDTILSLHEFWRNYGCLVLSSYDVEVGAGTFHPDTALRSLGPNEWNVAYVQVSRRPADGRYGVNRNRLQRYHQYQVLLKPSPTNIQELYLRSLFILGIKSNQHDIRFVEDNWESPSLGAAGLGWEIWCDGMEISQFTYFQQMGGFECNPVSVELTYGLERLSMKIQGCNNVNDIYLDSNKKIKYGEVYSLAEEQFSVYNFSFVSTDILKRHFFDAEFECFYLLKNNLPLPAYDKCLRSNYLFNLLDSRGILSVLERASFILRLRNMSKSCILYLFLLI